MAYKVKKFNEMQRREEKWLQAVVLFVLSVSFTRHLTGIERPFSEGKIIF